MRDVGLVFGSSPWPLTPKHSRVVVFVVFVGPSSWMEPRRVSGTRAARGHPDTAVHSPAGSSVCRMWCHCSAACSELRKKRTQ